MSDRALSPAVLALLALLLPRAAAHAAEPSVTGLWYDEPRKGAILIAPCGDSLCGHITWLGRPLTDAGQPRLDAKNQAPGQRSRPICGLEILSGFHAAHDPGVWEGGLIYNPEDGATYKSTLRLNADGTLHVRGYIGIPLFGKSETWTRAPADLPACDAAAAK